MAVWILDASHGGNEFGIKGKNGRTESTIALEAVLEAKKHLERNGEEVVLTRSSDITISTEERIKIANESNGIYFISFQMNSSEDRKTTGVSIETINITDSEDRLVKLSKDELLGISKSEDRGVSINTNSEYAALKIKGIKVFAEYLTNEEVEANFSSEKYGELIAKACLAVVNKVLLTTPIIEPKPMQEKAWRVCLGHYKTYDEAEKQIRELNAQGINTAFIVPVDK